MRLLIIATIALVLCGCGRWPDPVDTCDARETVSGMCTHTHYACPEPMKLYSEWGSPVCTTRNPTLPDDGKLKEMDQ
jgi:hypothetical protein